MAACTITDEECLEWCEDWRNQNECKCDSVGDVINKLGTYEDTGLTPEEVAALKAENILLLVRNAILATEIAPLRTRIENATELARSLIADEDVNPCEWCRTPVEEDNNGDCEGCRRYTESDEDELRFMI